MANIPISQLGQLSRQALRKIVNEENGLWMPEGDPTGVSLSTAEIQGAYDEASAKIVSTGRPQTVVFPLDCRYAIDAGINTKGVNTVTMGFDLGTSFNGFGEINAPTEIISRIPRDPNPIIGSDISIAANGGISSVSTDLSGLQANEIILITGGTANDHIVVTVKQASTANQIQTMLSNQSVDPGKPNWLHDESPGASIRIERLTPMFYETRGGDNHPETWGPSLSGLLFTNPANNNVTDYPTILGDYGYVVGYYTGFNEQAGGAEPESSSQIYVRGAAHRIAGGLIHTGWWSHMQWYSSYCPLAYMIGQCAGNEMWMTGNFCGSAYARSGQTVTGQFNYQSRNELHRNGLKLRELDGFVGGIRLEGILSFLTTRVLDTFACNNVEANVTSFGSGVMTEDVMYHQRSKNSKWRTWIGTQGATFVNPDQPVNISGQNEGTTFDIRSDRRIQTGRRSLDSNIGVYCILLEFDPTQPAGTDTGVPMPTPYRILGVQTLGGATGGSSPTVDIGGTVSGNTVIANELAADNASSAWTDGQNIGTNLIAEQNFTAGAGSSAAAGGTCRVLVWCKSATIEND